MRAKRFKSKVDAWLVVVLVAAMAVQLIVTVHVLYAGQDAVAGAVAVVALLLVYLLIGLTLKRTWYEVDDRQLRIVCGIFRWTIPLADIDGVESTRSPLSSPALSLDRLRIRYRGKRSILVSPADRGRFVAALGLDPAAVGR